jgi:glycosyltransferase involved in cell wall biosynthesis
MMRKAAWLVPSLIEGSGGHRTIFQNIQYLIDKGYECDVYVEDKGDVKSADELPKQVKHFFDGCTCKFFLGFDLKGEYDIIFATVWYSAKIVRDFKTVAKKSYFVQDFEALFNPMGDGYLLACNSYCYGLHPITIGRWLSNKMQEEFNTPSQYFDFCADRKVYRRLKNPVKENAVCFIYQPDKPRRCSALGVEALGIVKYLRPDVKIYLYGSNIKGNVWFEHTNKGIVSVQECNELYNLCKVGLCISSSNPSRIPFEMMAAGLPVVDLYMENNFYDMPEGGVSLTHYTPESIAQAIINILDDEEKASNMSAYGMNYMEERTLEYGYEQFYCAVENILNSTEYENVAIEKCYKTKPVIADILEKDIPQYKVDTIHNKGIIEKLKRNRIIRRSKLIRRIWSKLHGY